jgi:hypothetical protein
MILYHGGIDIIEKPVIVPHSGGCDFGMGFYSTDIHSQAEKWAKRQGRVRKRIAVLNIYEFNADQAKSDLKIKMFKDYSQEWLELIINCRRGSDFIHGFDIVYWTTKRVSCESLLSHDRARRNKKGINTLFGKIANDDVGETVQAVVDGLMPFDFALQKLVFMPSNNQYCFCTEESLAYIGFIMFYESHVGGCYADDGTGLYGQSAAYVFSLFCEEMSDEKNLHGRVTCFCPLPPVCNGL